MNGATTALSVNSIGVSSAVRLQLTPTLIGALLITGGVVGEGWIEFRASILQTSIRAQNDAAFAGLGALVNKSITGCIDSGGIGGAGKRHCLSSRRTGETSRGKPR
jgi:hypothetical protein